MDLEGLKMQTNWLYNWMVLLIIQQDRGEAWPGNKR
jgi:hypothetical protein